MLPEATREGLPVAGLSIASETWQPSFVTGQGLLPTVGRPGTRVKASVAPPCPVAAEDNAKPEHILLGMQGHSANSHHMQQVELKAQVMRASAMGWGWSGPFHPQPIPSIPSPAQSSDMFQSHRQHNSGVRTMNMCASPGHQTCFSLQAASGTQKTTDAEDCLGRILPVHASKGRDLP